MEASTLGGPFLSFLIVWGIATATFLALLLWRSILTTHEDDQLCIDAAGEHVAQEQRELIAKITRLSKPIATSGIAAGGAPPFITRLWVFQRHQNLSEIFPSPLPCLTPLSVSP